MKQEPKHIKDGRVAAAKLTEADVKSLLLKKVGYYFDWPTSNTLNGWLQNIAYYGGTFGNFYGMFDTGSKSQNYIKIRLADGRNFKFDKSEIFNNRSVQGVLL